MVFSTYTNDNYVAEHSIIYQVQAHQRSPCNLHIFSDFKSVDREVEKYKIFITILREKIFAERSTGHIFDAV